jgi:hypothetical protein
MISSKTRREQLQAVWANTPWADIATYIGPNAEKFRTAWEKQRAVTLKKGGGFSWSFCWPALFLSFVWFFYRKQWLAGAILIILPIILVALFPTISGALGGVAIALSMMAKSLYLQDILPKIAKITAATPVGAARQTALASAGGTSKLAGIISLIFLAVALVGAGLSVANGQE